MVKYKELYNEMSGWYARECRNKRKLLQKIKELEEIILDYQRKENLK